MGAGLPSPGALYCVPVQRPADVPAGRGSLGRRLGSLGPFMVVAATVALNLWFVRATTVGVAYLDDSSVQQELVRSAGALIRAGHNPLDSWFPYLGLGSPNFLHYQSTPAMLTATAGLLVGSNTAFRWSLYLLWSLWPIAIYASARIFGLRRWAAAAAAAVSPLLASYPGIGYEQKAYLWIGYGVWAQLWASWALPFAWAFGWRAVGDRRFVAPAAAAVALTAALHFETGYLAFIPLVLFPFLVPSDLWRRLGRAALTGAGAVLASAWVVLPLLLLGKWASVNEALQGGPLPNGYGARQVVGWLVTGKLFDNGHLPVVTLLAAVGLIAVLIACDREPTGRPLVVLTALGLVLAFGRTTFGSLTRIVPGSADLFFRRFEIGAMLGAIYLAGIGAATLASGARRALTVVAGAAARRWSRARLVDRRWIPVALVSLVGAACLFPLWRSVGSYDSLNSADVHRQAAFEQQVGPEVDPLVAEVAADGGGRVFAGMPSDWGRGFTVGFVPVFEYLASRDVDEVGFTLRTASLMTGPEYDFDEVSTGDYALFGIRWLILPAGRRPPVPAHLVRSSGPFRLYEIPADGYLRVVDTVGSVREDRADVAHRTISYLEGPLPVAGSYLTVGFAGARPPAPTAPRGTQPAGSPGDVVAAHVDLPAGTATATVRLARRAVVVLSASYDPGWTATVDGRRVPTQMLAPALVGVAVPAGEHRIAFQYVGFGWYGELFALAVVTLVALVLLTTPAGRRARARLGRRRRRRSKAPAVPDPPVEEADRPTVGVGP